MSLLASKFDIVSVDNPIAYAALAQVLPVSGGMSLNGNGTPVAGSIPPGTIVTLASTGFAAVATTGVVSSATSANQANKQMVFVTIDGNEDFSGSFVQKLTVLQGGFTMLTDQYNVTSYSPGMLVTFDTGKIKPANASGADQVIGIVGPAGLDTVNGVLQVIVPQGFGG